MTIRHLFIPAVITSTLFTSCMSSKEWIDDDVYVMKSAEVPTDTDVTDETDYNAYVYNRRNNPAQTNYYSQYNFYPGYNSWMMYSGFGYNNFGYMGGWGRSPYYGMGFYDPYYSSIYGYGYNPYGYSPYGYGYGYGYGYPYYGSGYGYGYGGGYGYGSNYGGSYGGSTASTGHHYSGPRGAISGYGGVRSHSPMGYKSATVPSTGPSRQVAQIGKTIARPVTSYDHAGRNSGTTIASSAPSRNIGTATSGTIARGGTATLQRHAGGTMATTVPRPASTSNRNVGYANRGVSRTGGYNTGSGVSRGGGTYNGGSVSRSGSSGGSISRSSGSSGVSRSSGSSGGGVSRSGGGGGSVGGHR